ncbi:hypothetical protein [Streptomyces sp. NPDC059783]|uniref:hypothetical protein n=1 Tax=Streptomyces sp. NPDC059783 TaxID=3346944 RepID=UPI00365B827D
MTETPAPRTCCTTGKCFDCRFWEEKVRWSENGDEMPAHGRHAAAPVARVNGWHYIVKAYNTTTPAQYLGFGGAVFVFRFEDGTELTSNDVMCQGEIPAHFRDRLPDNAVIVPQTPPRTTVPFGEFEGLL